MNKTMKQLIKNAVVAIMLCVIAYIVLGYAGQVYAQSEAHRIGRVMAENAAYNDSVEATMNRTIVLPKKDFGEQPKVTAEVSGYEYWVVDSMYRAAMSCRDLNEDFEQIFPREYVIMNKCGVPHDDCVECRLKAITAAYGDAEWDDCFDDCNPDDVYSKFEKVLRNNAQLNSDFQNLVKYCWGE